MKEVELLAEEFKSCQKILLALGDENRQNLILQMMKIGECNGVRVGQITKVSHLSRPAVSHHLSILKEAGFIKRRREGTKNYYYFDADHESLNNLLKLLNHTKEIMASLPNRKGEE